MFAWVRDLVDGFKGSQWKGYCFKCRRKRKIDNPKTEIWANGRETQQGSCVHCGTHISVISGHRLRKA